MHVSSTRPPPGGRPSPRRPRTPPDAPLRAASRSCGARSGGCPPLSSRRRSSKWPTWPVPKTQICATRLTRRKEKKDKATGEKVVVPPVTLVVLGAVDQAVIQRHHLPPASRHATASKECPTFCAAEVDTHPLLDRGSWRSPAHPIFGLLGHHIVARRLRRPTIARAKHSALCPHGKGIIIASCAVTAGTSMSQSTLANFDAQFH